MRFPFGEAMPKVTFCTGRGLIAVLGGLCEQFHNNRREPDRHTFGSFVRRHRMSGDLAVYPFHRIRRGKGRRSGQHLVERGAEGIEVASRVDRAIHPPGLLGSHVRKGSCDELRRLGGLVLAPNARSNPKTPQTDLIRRGIDQNIGWLYILMNQPPCMKLAERSSKANGQPQKRHNLHRASNQTIERLATRVLEHECLLAVVPGQGERANRPLCIELIPERVYAPDLLERLGAGPGRRRTQQKDRGELPLIGVGAVKYELPVVAEAVERIPRKVQSHTSARLHLLTCATSGREIRLCRGPSEVGERCTLHLLVILTTVNLQCNFTNADFPVIGVDREPDVSSKI